MASAPLLGADMVQPTIVGEVVSIWGNEEGRLKQAQTAIPRKQKGNKMSYDIEFQKDGKTCTLPFSPPHCGTYCASEDFCEAWLNITYNYAKIYYEYGLSISKLKKHERGIRVLEGKSASQCVRILTSVIPQLGNETDPDYWKPTEGNAKQALVNLLSIAVAVPPDAICYVG